MPLVLAAFSLLQPVLPNLYLYASDPAVGGDRPEFVRSISWLEAKVQKDDMIVLDSYGTPLWHYMMNAWSASVPWYSLPFEIPGSVGTPSGGDGNPSEATLSLFSRASEGYSRLWYVATGDAPDFGLRREVDWLDRSFRLAISRSFSGTSVIEVRLYVVE
jgi:hypothetical protein